MDIDRLKSLSTEDRKAVLESEAIAVEEGKYTKPLTESEILYFKDQLAEQSINQAIILDEFKKVKESYKDRLEPIAKDISSAIQAIKFKAVEQCGRLYKMADYESKMIHKVDELGNVIHSRQMLPEERQYRMQALNQKSA
jgi:hypothetical protein